MMICNKCNKKYENNFLFCTSCGTKLDEFNEEIIEVQDSFVEENLTHETISISEKEINSTDLAEKKTVKAEENHCTACGSVILYGEKFCIKCGKSTQINVSESINNKDSADNTEIGSRLQYDLERIFKSNKFFEFFYDYAFIFTFIYPITLIVGRLFSNDFVDILTQISNITFYGYYIGLIALYTKKNYLIMIAAVVVRSFYSILSVYQNDTYFSSLSRLVVLAVFLVYLFKEFSKTEQYQYILSKLNFDIKTCPHCNSRINKSNRFCSKCGYEMEDIL